MDIAAHVAKRWRPDAPEAKTPPQANVDEFVAELKKGWRDG